VPFFLFFLPSPQNVCARAYYFNSKHKADEATLTFLTAAPKPAAGAGAAVRVRQAELKALAFQLRATRLLAVTAKHSFSAGCEPSEKHKLTSVFI